MLKRPGILFAFMKIKVFIVGSEGAGKNYAMVVADQQDVILIRRVHDRYDFFAGVKALAPDAEEDCYYIGLFRKERAELAAKLDAFIELEGSSRAPII
jgi:hypothetical protein